MGLSSAAGSTGFENIGARTIVGTNGPDVWNVDPLAEDRAEDRVVVTTDRGLVRLAVAASEVGARFAREGIAHDPAAWMLAPRAMFDGRAAIDACTELSHFHRNIVMHGLSLGLDAEPSELDKLLAHDPQEGTADRADPDYARSADCRVWPAVDGCRQLLTCWIDADRGGVRMFAFCAMVTDDPSRLVERVVDRYGKAAADAAVFSSGFDASTPMACAMISESMADTLKLVEASPESPLAAGLDVVVEQRFQS